jgi:argininosuccinate lyase
MPLWNSRFKKPLDDRALAFSSSVELDKRLYNEDLDGSIAHVRMLVKQKIIPTGEGRAIVRGLEEIRKEIASGKLKPHWCDEDIHTLIEERLVTKIGEKGKRLHTGRSRNDQIALDERLYLRNEIHAIITAIRSLQRSLLKQAKKQRNTIVPGYTHLQRAQPILFAHHLLAYIAMLDRDSERFEDCVKRANKSPLGAAAFAGTSLPIDRKFVARQLTFDGIVVNSIDAVSDRDVQIEFISACAMTMMHLSRLAEEIVLWTTTEFGFAEIDDSFATGSSLMPQKKNPDIAELIRGKTGRVYGALVGMLTVMKALPLAYNRDMQEDKIHLFEAADTTRQSLVLAAELLAHTRFNPKRFEKELDGDLMLATDIAEYLVRKGMAFREAHSTAGRIVALAVEKRCRLNELSLSDFQGFSQLFGKSVFALMAARASALHKRSAGSTNEREVAKALTVWTKKLFQS